MKNILPAVLASILLASSAAATETGAAPRTTESSIDFAGFVRASEEVLEVRAERLLPLDEFLALAAEPGTLVLDSRSRKAYEQKRLAGAVHLNLSDFTEESLSRVVGPRHRRILIYCNNNFADDVKPFQKKVAVTALNIPTFISLWAYGYEEVYELGELLEQSDPRLEFDGALVSADRAR